MICDNRQIPESVSEFFENCLLVPDDRGLITLPLLYLAEKAADFADKTENG
ncbi:MAG: hypothetical protein ACK4QP_06305 [Pseudorhizobium sp.]